MTEEKRFFSILAPYIAGVIEEKHSLGFNYYTEELILLRFDKYCIEKGLKTVNVTKPFLDEWCRQLDTEGLSNHGKRITAVRQLMLYMLSLGIVVHLPKNRVRPETILPHIFTDDELQGFFHEVDSYMPATNCPAHKRLAKEYQVLFRMLYCCGMRNSEGCRIASDQVDLEKGILTILGSKGEKDRLVYMADDLTETCRLYYEDLCRELSFSPQWFFPGIDPGKPLVNTSIDRVFNRFWNRTAFSSLCGKKPTVHDLRFTFVTDRINQ